MSDSPIPADALLKMAEAMVRSGKMSREQADALLRADGVDRSAIEPDFVDRFEMKVWEILARDDSDIALTQLSGALAQQAELAERAAPERDAGEEALVERRANEALTYLFTELRGFHSLLQETGSVETMVRWMRAEVRAKRRSLERPDGGRVIMEHGISYPIR